MMIIDNTHSIALISFGTTSRLKKNQDGSFIGYYTKMFREDLDWDKFKDYIDDNYPKGGKVDIFACSDGSEAYSVALKLNASKYKISASDADHASIALANKGLINLNNRDLQQIEVHTGQKWSEFFTNLPRRRQCKVNDVLKNSVQFSVFDIRDGFNSHDLTNDIVCMIRNVWYHFSKPEQRRIIETLHANLPAGSTFVIGEQEQLQCPKDFPKLIETWFAPVSGFVNRNGHYLFRK